MRQRKGIPGPRLTRDLQADLHIHTTASDGTITPADVVECASRMGLAAIAITDHDTAAGVAEAIAAAKGLDIEVVPGLEINTDVGGREVHILGYYAWPLTPRLAGILELMRSAREDRIDEMVRRLEKHGVRISAGRVREIAGGGVVGRPHVARAMVEAGKVRSIEEAFYLYLDIGRPCYVERFKISPQEAVAEIALAGGAPVLAHPGSARRDDLIPDLIASGLRGIEVYHPDHDAGAVERYLSLCRREGLIPTGGSDSHGEDDRGITVGRITVSFRAVADLKAAKRQLEYPTSAHDIIHPGASHRGGDRHEARETTGGRGPG